MEMITHYLPTSANIQDIFIPMITIPLIDILLCLCIGTRARWFQLHSVINSIIVYIIFPDVYKLIINPVDNVEIVNSKIDCNYIILLHIYHAIALQKLTYMDYCHHIIFVGFGCVPIFYFYNSNLIRLGILAGCGLLGAIEYFSLTLVKHNKLSSLRQKYMTSYLYNYIRYPISIYACSIIYIRSILNPIEAVNPYIVLYVIFFIFLNGSYYNKLAIENYIHHLCYQRY